MKKQRHRNRANQKKKHEPAPPKPMAKAEKSRRMDAMANGSIIVPATMLAAALLGVRR